ncbi:gluzincin family metallopeptidase [Deminuibacter soli]|uniref:M1 family peptidase n=1 Tax=Deminuibacter soli TaxID=2291815 RepID=A0A3E1NDG6_9BACT|nr:hypothetical protein [Deminuibacter soli]RFM26009.1 hypothetical protein DXN05_22050 [Deminuibacter soli]
MKKSLIQLLCLLIVVCTAGAQPGKEHMPAGTIPEYSWWNLLHYTISITPDYNKKFLAGTNTIRFRALQAGRLLQLDLLEPMKITAVTWKQGALPFMKKGTAYQVSFPKAISKGETVSITVHFEGNPVAAKRPPWDAGWIWSADKQGRPWMSIACEAAGGALWLPCKRAAYDEPDNGVVFSITIPDTLVSTTDILPVLNQVTGRDFSKVFDQYLRSTNVPVLEYALRNDTLQYRWANCVDGFDMPVKITAGPQPARFIYPDTQWQKMPIGTGVAAIAADRNFYVKCKLVQ